MPIKIPSVRLSDSIPRLFGTTVAKTGIARLGDPSQNYKVEVDETDKFGLVYVHGIGDTPFSAYTAENSIGIKELIPGRLVKIRPMDNNRYEIVGLASEDGEFMEGVSLHDQTPVYRSQLIDGGLQSNNSDTVLTVGTTWVVDNTTTYVTTDQNTGDLLDGTTNDTGASAIQPPSTANKAIYVLVQIDPTTNTLSYKQGSEFNASFTYQLAHTNSFVPAPDLGRAILGYVKLINGMTAINQEHIVSLPDIFRLTTGATGGTLDIEGTYGEALSALDNVYLDSSNNKWYKIDTDATATVKNSYRRAVAVDAGALDATGTIRLKGVLDGYTSLNTGDPIYASTTAGGYTQTKPAVTDGGGQVAIVEMGYAVSATEVMVDPRPVIYAKRETLANNASTTIEHHADTATFTRQVSAYAANNTSGSEVAVYGTINQGVRLELEGETIAGDTITINASGAHGVLGKNSGGTQFENAMSFSTVNGGQLTQFTFDLVASTGSPTGGITWYVETDNSGEPSGTNLGTGYISSPTASATNTVSSLSIYLNESTLYWLRLVADTQSTNNYWRMEAQSSSIYSGGNRAYSGDGGSSWTTDAYDYAFSFTISSHNENDKLAQGFQVTGSQTINDVELYLKKEGTPTGTMTCRIETDNSGEPSGTLVDANATTTVAESTVTTSYTEIQFTFSTTFTISGSTQYWIVLSTSRAQDATNNIHWGADSSAASYANGEMMRDIGGTWVALNPTYDAIFAVNSAATAYEEPMVIGMNSGGTRDVAVRFDDGADADPTIKTTFANKTGVSADIVCEVILS